MVDAVHGDGRGLWCSTKCVDMWLGLSSCLALDMAFGSHLTTYDSGYGEDKIH